MYCMGAIESDGPCSEHGVVFERAPVGQAPSLIVSSSGFRTSTQAAIRIWISHINPLIVKSNTVGPL